MRYDYIHPGEYQAPKPPKTLWEQWTALRIDWVTVGILVVGGFLVWAALADQCDDIVDNENLVCLTVPH